jgi:hypothetical protein
VCRCFCVRFPSPNYFDAVISSDFFEHITLEVKVAAFKTIYTVSTLGRPLVVKTPNLCCLRLSLFCRRTRALFGFRNPSKIVIPHTLGTDDPQHIGLTTRWEPGRLLQATGFLRHEIHHARLRRFGSSPLVEVLSTAVPVFRDWLSEDVVCVAHKPVTLAHSPD